MIAPQTYAFRPYRPGETQVPVTCVTPGDGFYLHTFYDVCPFSPSGRYLAVTRLPFQDQEPQLGDRADVCVIDLENERLETVTTTRAWGIQVGANVQWGATDRYLFTNKIVNGEAVCARIDRETGEVTTYAGPMYHASPDGASVIGVPPAYLNATQSGYGAPLMRALPPGAAHDEGLWLTELATNRRTLLMSISEILRHAREPLDVTGEHGTFYFFHAKYNPQGTRISQVVRCMIPGQPGWHPQLYTFSADGSDVHQTVKPSQWAAGGHHPNWHPDGKHIVMNLKPEGGPLRFCQIRYNGGDIRVLSTRHLGSGHPSVEPRGRFLITDCYVGEPMTRDNGEVPLRLLDLTTDEALDLCDVDTLSLRGTLRLDPHPAWSRDYTRVCFNGALDGKRQVFIADLAALV